jgi:hypothetical protein
LVPEDETRYDETSLMQKSNHTFKKAVPLIEIMAKATNQKFVDSLHMELQQREHIADSRFDDWQNARVRKCLPELYKNADYFTFFIYF